MSDHKFPTGPPALIAAIAVAGTATGWLFGGLRSAVFFAANGLVWVLVAWWRRSRPPTTDPDHLMRANVIGAVIATVVGLAIVSMALFVSGGGWFVTALGLIGGGLLIVAGAGGGVAYWRLYGRGTARRPNR
jgi:peptidoglycan biosynthesis protein MviN/MurJ (putative lipid II flippase)